MPCRRSKRFKRQGRKRIRLTVLPSATVCRCRTVGHRALLPGEALELAALLTRSTRKLEKRQG